MCFIGGPHRVKKGSMECACLSAERMHARIKKRSKFAEPLILGSKLKQVLFLREKRRLILSKEFMEFVVFAYNCDMCTHVIDCKWKSGGSTPTSAAASP